MLSCLQYRSSSQVIGQDTTSAIPIRVQFVPKLTPKSCPRPWKSSTPSAANTWEHDEIASNRPPPSPPTSPPVDDQPVQQPQGDQDEDHNTEVISNAIHHLVAKSTKDNSFAIFSVVHVAPKPVTVNLS